MTPGVSKKTCFLIAIVLAAGFSYGLASSHREAPFITGMPKVDGTDFYMFRSYEPGRDGFVTQALEQGNTYVNIHSGSHPPGEIRGQLR